MVFCVLFAAAHVCIIIILQLPVSHAPYREAQQCYCVSDATSRSTNAPLYYVMFFVFVMAGVNNACLDSTNTSYRCKVGKTTM